MTRFAPLWQDNSTYPALWDRALVGALWPSGGASGSPPVPVNNTMNVNIPAGFCAVPLQSGQGVALCRWDAQEQVTIGAAPGAGTSRIDLVVCQVRDQAIDSGSNNDFLFQVVAGTPAASPAAPAVPANAFSLMQFTIASGIANLNTAPRRDMRLPLGGQRAFARVWRNAAFGFTSTRSVLNFDSVAEDVYGAYAAGLYTCRWAGVYRVTSHVSLTLAASLAADLNVNRNGTSSYITLGGVTGSASNAGRMLGDSGPFRCNAGDTLGVEIWANASAAGVQGQGLTWATFEYLGA